ncbi:hotdog fold thioesterase [Vagococcus vulneris]|uniref:Aromatic compound catabolic protein n=1 Tax=Vagococcus vulneris TaxID=1977869 RepID=A0A429ZYA0_9ENTE|nr:hotdog fold thioesterase [Vagococcus vulneris]RST98921.1 aromatic compound catabolic protein [Vagococcus vulneris]
MNLIDLLNISVQSQTPEQVIMTMPVTGKHLQPYGVLHGGLNGVLIETACSQGALLNLHDSAKHAVGIDLQVNHLAPVSSGTITVIAKPNRVGRLIQVWEATIYDEQNTITSVGRCTLTAITNK